MDYSSVLKETINQLVINDPSRGLLAADESVATIQKRFDSIGVENNEENRRLYRELLFTTPNFEKYICGVIMFDETLHHSTADGLNFIELLNRINVVPGIKVDEGLTPMSQHSPEKITKGLDTLSERCKKYFELGCRFAKWRAVFTVSQDGIYPTPENVDINTRDLAQYALICQQNGIVPVIEPEILMDGDFTMARYAEATENVLRQLYQHCEKINVHLQHTILKTNMIVPSTKSKEKMNASRVAVYTYRVLKETVPETVPSIMFLSGGQSEDDAADNLSMMKTIYDGDLPWNLSFSYGRALQQSCLQNWMGRNENWKLAQRAFVYQAEIDYST